MLNKEHENGLKDVKFPQNVGAKASEKMWLSCCIKSRRMFKKYRIRYICTFIHTEKEEWREEEKERERKWLKNASRKIFPVASRKEGKNFVWGGGGGEGGEGGGRRREKGWDRKSIDEFSNSFFCVWERESEKRLHKRKRRFLLASLVILLQ